MTEDAKLKQVMNKINDAISWIKQLNCIVLNSINTELNPDDGSVLLYLQTPNNLIVPSLLLNVQAYDYLLEQDDASNGEGIIIVGLAVLWMPRCQKRGPGLIRSNCSKIWIICTMSGIN